MRKRLFHVSVATAAVALASIGVFAQGTFTTADKFVISARAGGINAVLGEATVSRAGSPEKLLVKGDVVSTGERVSTTFGGKVEVLLNPGSYIRLGSNSSFEFESTSLDDLQVRIHSGSAILEVFGAEEMRLLVTAGTSEFSIYETGIYRFDVNSNGSVTACVYKGKLRSLGSGNYSADGGKRITFSNGTYTVAKFDRDVKDDLTGWSGDRAKDLSKLSASLRRDTLRDPLINSFYNNRWDLYSSFGLWVYDPFFRTFCFLPFGYGWYSPYGYGFGRPIWYYNLPVAIYKQPPPAGFRGRNPVVPVEPGPTKGLGRSGNSSSDDSRKVRGDDDSFKGPRREPRNIRVEEPRISPPIFSPPVNVAPPRDTKKP